MTDETKCPDCGEEYHFAIGDAVIKKLKIPFTKFSIALQKETGFPYCEQCAIDSMREQRDKAIIRNDGLEVR